jgi:2-C-methyl-D-erythritol 4-phosphate cytidylyltransferase
VPKQLLKIAGKSILEHTLDIFQTAPEVDEIIVLMTPGFTADVEQIVTRSGLSKVTAVLEGGATRNETTQRALDQLGDAECNVLFHDAVRPLLDHRIITDCVAALADHEAVDVVIPSADTIVVVDDERVVDIPSRDRLRRGQTPQAFRASTIRRAYERAAADPNFTATDDCSVVLRYCPESPIYAVTGAEHNMKVTHPIDVFLADKLFQLASRSVTPPDSDDGYTEQLTGKTMVVFGGSYGIGADIVALAETFGCRVFAHSRSMSGTDVTDPAAVRTALEKAHGETGRIDYVVNTAGVLARGLLADMADTTIDESIELNFRAPVLIAQLALPYLRETHGQLLLFTSSSYTRGRAGYSLYSSTKAAVVNLTQALADEWSEYNVRVNCMNPERTRTPMRVRAFGAEPPETLLSSDAVARTSLDCLLAPITGLVVDVRREPAQGPRAGARSDSDRIASALAEDEVAAAAEAAHEHDLRSGGQ